MTAPMDDAARTPATDSPCVQICLLHPEARICVGCYRTGEEIARWRSMPVEERARVLAELPGRAEGLTARRGGRAGRAGRGRGATPG